VPVVADRVWNVSDLVAVLESYGRGAEKAGVKITNKHKLSKKNDDKVAARRRIRRHDFESGNSRNGRANLKRLAVENQGSK
jgi:hypothetical protein